MSLNVNISNPIYLNTNFKIVDGKRRACKYTIPEFKEKLIKCVSSWYTKTKDINVCLNKVCDSIKLFGTGIDEENYPDFLIKAAADSDLDFYYTCGDDMNSIQLLDDKFYMTTTGLAYMPYYIYNEIPKKQAALLSILYFDGKKFRTYTPKKGNTVKKCPLSYSPNSYHCIDLKGINAFQEGSTNLWHDETNLFLKKQTGLDLNIDDVIDRLIPNVDMCIEDFTRHVNVI